MSLDQRGRDFVVSAIYGEDTFSRSARCAAAAAREVWTWLPEGVEPERAYQFKQLGYIPENLHNVIHRAGPMVRVISFKAELAEHIRTALTAPDPLVCVIEHAAAKPGVGPAEFQAKTVAFEGHVYFLLDRSSTAEDIDFVLRYAQTVWRMVGVIGRGTVANMHGVLQNIEDVFTVAYDGEGFIICQV